MKRIAGGILIQLLISIALVSCASMPKEPISEANLSDLRGEWKGSRTVQGGTFRTEMEIYNNTVPLQGKFIFHDVKRKMGGTYTLQFREGMIKDSNLYLARGKDHFELSLHKGDGKMKLKGGFFADGYNGTISLFKK